MDTRQIKTKRPWVRVKPDGYMKNGTASGMALPNTANDPVFGKIVTQSDFLRELQPSGHAINSDEYYPDILKEEIYSITDEDGNDTGRKGTRIYKEFVPRYAFAFQQIILIKQLVHLCGNDIQFELNEENPTSEQNSLLSNIRKGWLKKDMEIAFYESAKSVKSTGDTAFVGFMKNGKFRWKVLSFLNGDTLYPHYDEAGELKLLARAYNSYDESGNTVTEWMEAWDDKFMYKLKRNAGNHKSIIDKFIQKLGYDGYSIVQKHPHGFKSIPVAYKRDENGPCWSDSQNSIDGYELSFSQMAQNNEAFGFPIMYLQGENILPSQHDLDGSIKVLTLGVDDKAGFLEQPSGSESYQRQLEFFYKMIYEQSFTVIPPELKSGDLPAAALKILYSPAYEKAKTDAQEYQKFLNDMVEIFLYGYGMEMENSINFMSLPVKAWIEPYVHVNNSSVMTDLAIGIQNGFVSKETASKKASFYTDTGEWDKILKEEKRQQEADLLYQMENNSRNADTGNNGSGEK